MKHLYNIALILAGALLATLVINDFAELLIEYLFNLEGKKLPIEFSKGGWKLKFWLIDHPPAFDVYQILYFAGGFVLIMSGLFPYLPKWAKMGAVAGLIGSALLVLLFPHLHYLTENTPKPFMYAQLVAGLALLPIVLNPKNISTVRLVAMYIAGALATLLLAVAVAVTPVTLWFALLLFGSVAGLFIIHFVTPKKAIS